MTCPGRSRTEVKGRIQFAVIFATVAVEETAGGCLAGRNKIVESRIVCLIKRRLRLKSDR